MPKLGVERTAVQKPLIKYAESVGWNYVDPEESMRMKGGETGLVYRDVFNDQMFKLNSDFMTDEIVTNLLKRIEKLPPRIEGNLQAWEYLKGLKTEFVKKEKRERNVKFIDGDVKNNVFHVTEEFRFSNGKYANRYDVVFLINGVPVFFVEAKAAHKLGGLDAAFEQVKRYHRETPEAMTLFQIFTLTHIISFMYSATWNKSMKWLFNWKAEDGSKDYEHLVKNFFDRGRVVKTILDFILFTNQDDELKKVILRPHQMRAVQKIEERALDSKKHRALVWHTQGSGKTYTMIVAAKRILENPLFENPTVIMLVDRNELETQLFGNISSLGFEAVEVATSKRHLKELLQNERKGLIVSMIHKFENMPKDINTNKNVFVLVDEAHRTTGGDLGNYLMGALPNATYLGFTGTPIDNKSKGSGTFVVFGRDDAPSGYLDKYAISESIADGTTVKLHYTLAPNDLMPDRKVLEEEFLDMPEIEGASDIEAINKVIQRATTLKNMLKNKQRVKKVAKFVVSHFKEFVEPMGYKAFLVGVDREACALYKKELDKLLPKEYSEVVYSPGSNDPPELAEYHISEDKEKRIRKDFRNPDKKPKILIVTEKLLTGFDAPVLYCMYLDKPMRDHVLLQAIARVNRPYEDEKGQSKPSGFVLDFIGIFDKLEKALAFDSGDVSGIIDDIEVLKEHFSKQMKEADKEYLSIIKGKTEDKAVEAVINHFMDEEIRQKFFDFFKEISNIYEILSPDAFLRPYIEDYDTLARMFRVLKDAYEPSLMIDREFANKTATLVREHTKSGKISASLEVYEINEKTIEKLESENKTDTEKIFNLLKSIGITVRDKKAKEPYLASIGEKAEIVSKLYIQRQKDTKDTLKELKKIVDEINSAAQERAEKDMPLEVFSAYWVMRDKEIPDPETRANEMKDVFKKYPHWRSSEEHQRKLKQEILKGFTKAKLTPKKSVDLTKEIIQILKET